MKQGAKQTVTGRRKVEDRLVQLQSGAVVALDDKLVRRMDHAAHLRATGGAAALRNAKAIEAAVEAQLQAQADVADQRQALFERAQLAMAAAGAAAYWGTRRRLAELLVAEVGRELAVHHLTNPGPIRADHVARARRAEVRAMRQAIGTAVVRVAQLVRDDQGVTVRGDDGLPVYVVATAVLPTVVHDGLQNLFDSGRLSEAAYAAGLYYRQLFEARRRSLKSGLAERGVPTTSGQPFFGAAAAMLVQGEAIEAFEAIAAQVGPKAVDLLRLVAGEGRTIREVARGGKARETATRRLREVLHLAAAPRAVENAAAVLREKRR